MTPDWVNQLNTIILNVVTTQQSIFQTWGNSVFVSLGIIILCIWGIQTALTGYVDFNSLVRTILLIATVKALLTAYSNSVSWMPQGMTLPQVIIGGPKYLASQLSYGSMQQMTNTINTILSQDPPNPITGINAAIQYWLSWLFLQLAQAVMWGVTCFGLVAQAVCVILGPIFIPMLLIKPFAFLFWGWLKSLLQYSFYPLVCACYTFVLSTFLGNELTTMYGSDGSLQSLVGGLVLLPYLVIIVLCMFTVPAVVSALFTGGQATPGGVLQGAAWLRMVTK
jgi:hypothetical protein